MTNGSLLHYLKRERRNLVLTEDSDGDEVGQSLYPQNCTLQGGAFELQIAAEIQITKQRFLVYLLHLSWLGGQ